jgi:threonine/homoserine/homoserine lactone efflux protein
MLLQCAVLGGLFVLIAVCTDASWSLAASGARSWLRSHPSSSRPSAS